ncbi:MAG: class I SAM-dependent methyltransferase [Eubacteriales bacterium]|nr:class I SAM-dependent methyltransferase [Eubacteriales bacterium]
MSYLEFAEIYDSLMTDIPYDHWVAFIKKKLSTRKNILEIACGTGNITRLLAEDNYKITAFDLSEEMLVKAYEKLRKYSNVSLYNMNMLDFEIDRSFDAAICCCDGINYILNEKDVEDFFRRVYNHMSPGGVFIFDYSTIHKFKNQLARNTIVTEEDEIFMVWENLYDDGDHTCEMTLNFFVCESNGFYRRIEEYQKQKSYECKIICSMLKQVGFSFVEVFDGYGDESYDLMSDRAVFVSKREN